MKSERVTQNIDANEQLLYFTSSSLWNDDSNLVFISDRNGHPNIYIRNLENGKEKKLTHNSKGFLKSYVYFNGTPYIGLGKASISLHSSSGTLYYIQGRDIRKVDSQGNNSLLAKYPKDQMTAFTHVSHDGKFLCVPTTDARALDGDLQLTGKPKYKIDKRVVKEKLNSYLRVYDTITGEEVICEMVEKAWITHVQFAPHDNNLILYNHEWPYKDPGIRRMWIFNGKKHLRLRPKTKGRSGKDGCVHEMWGRDGSAIIYHGTYHKGPAYIGRVDADGSNLVEIALPKGWKRYGHFTVGNSGMLITDGYYEEKGEKHQNQGGWISQIDVDWSMKKIQWKPLCKSGSSWNSQDEHPHPIFDHNLKYAYFTSDFEGKRAVYRIKIE